MKILIKGLNHVSLLHVKTMQNSYQDTNTNVHLLNRMMRRTFGPKKGEDVGGCKKLHNEEHHNFYASQNIITAIKSYRMRWTDHVACVGETGNTRFLSENLKGRDQS
jgi:hypothetical protein